MFSGIIQAVSKVKKAEHHSGSLFLSIDRPIGWKITPGDSIATNGVCLTVRSVNKKMYTTELMDETLSVSSFGKTVPAQVNLEPALRLGASLDGALVLGHVDTVGQIKKMTPRGRAKMCVVQFSARFGRYVVLKGSITLNGVNLTIVDCSMAWCSVSLVEYTLQHTTFGQNKVGDLVNIEFDIIGKYVEKIIRKK